MLLEKFQPDDGDKVLVIDSNKDLPFNWRELLTNNEVALDEQWQSFIEERENKLDGEECKNEIDDTNKTNRSDNIRDP